MVGGRERNGRILYVFLLSERLTESWEISFSPRRSIWSQNKLYLFSKFAAFPQQLRVTRLQMEFIFHFMSVTYIYGKN